MAAWVGMRRSGLVADNLFWKFSVAVYAAPGVADECIELQDRHDIDVNVLMFCAWLGWSRKVGLTAKDIEAIDRLARAWNENAVKPLRAVRRFTKGMPEAEIRSLRARVKTVELDAEKVEQGMLYAYAERQFPVAENAAAHLLARANLQAFLDVRGCGQGPGEIACKCLYRAILALQASP
jgi:uncharacterized protein (TIGR02444 family)